MPRRRPDRETPSGKKRKAHAKDMVIARYYGGDSYAECWYYAHPESKAKPDSARVMGQREISWYINTYPRESEELISQLIGKQRQKASEKLRQERKERTPDNGSSEPLDSSSVDCGRTAPGRLPSTAEIGHTAKREQVP